MHGSNAEAVGERDGGFDANNRIGRLSHPGGVAKKPAGRFQEDAGQVASIRIDHDFAAGRYCAVRGNTCQFDCQAVRPGRMSVNISQQYWMIRCD